MAIVMHQQDDGKIMEVQTFRKTDHRRLSGICPGGRKGNPSVRENPAAC